MIALIDADIVAYRCSASCQPSKKKAGELGIPFEELQIEDESFAIKRADDLIHRIISATGSTEYKLFLSGAENFRNLIYPLYKAHRINVPKPKHLDGVRRFLVSEWGSSISAGYEADDGIGMAASRDTITCSIDKDLRQIEGHHYNFVKDEYFQVTPDDGIRAFYTQLLVGDTSDNVRGVDGIGPVRAARIIGSTPTEELDSVVSGCYEDRKRYLLNRKLLKVLRTMQEYEEICEDIEREKQGQELTEKGAGCRIGSFY